VQAFMKPEFKPMAYNRNAVAEAIKMQNINWDTAKKMLFQRKIHYLILFECIF
jgi:hypothetical protein